MAHLSFIDNKPKWKDDTALVKESGAKRLRFALSNKMMAIYKCIAYSQ
jgi:hypothetical protein